jgi:hypothetical protein
MNFSPCSVCRVKSNSCIWNPGNGCKYTLLLCVLKPSYWTLAIILELDPIYLCSFSLNFSLTNHKNLSYIYMIQELIQIMATKGMPDD